MELVAGYILFFLAMLCYKKGLDELSAHLMPKPFSGRRPARAARRVSRGYAATGDQKGSTAPVRVESLNCPKCGAKIQESDRQCPYCGSTLVVVSPGKREVLTLQHLDWVKLGDFVRVLHPTQGQATVRVRGRVVYDELWQERRGGPWVPTGNAFAGFWLEAKQFLLNWQNRFYLLEDRREVSDVEIRRDFAPHAHKFGQSDQTATVTFEYPPGRWRIDDIGKFRVRSVEGEGIAFRPEAIGRFIHASGEGGRALAVEDYESGGGGQDTIWIGYPLQDKDVQKPGE